MCRRRCHSELLHGWRWPQIGDFWTILANPATCLVITVVWPSSSVSSGALDSTVIKAPSASNWSVFVQGKDFPEVASPFSALGPS